MIISNADTRYMYAHTLDTYACIPVWYCKIYTVHIYACMHAYHTYYRYRYIAIDLDAYVDAYINYTQYNDIILYIIYMHLRAKNHLPSCTHAHATCPIGSTETPLELMNRSMIDPWPSRTVIMHCDWRRHARGAAAAVQRTHAQHSQQGVLACMHDARTCMHDRH